MVRELQIKKIPASFRYAARGIWHVLQTEQNLRIHFLATVVVLVLAILFRITLIELCILLLVIGFVLASEILNSVIEDFLDVIHPEHHQAVRRIKDVLAGSVLLSAGIAVAIGSLIFLPRFVAAFNSGAL